MATKFNCPKCHQDIIVHYLKVGEPARCPHCGENVAVPEDARTVKHDGSIFSSRPIRPVTPQVVIHPQYSGWITLLKVLGWIFFIGGGLIALLFLIIGMVSSTQGSPAGPANMVIALYIFFIAVLSGVFYIAMAIIIKCLVEIRNKISD